MSCVKWNSHSSIVCILYFAFSAVAADFTAVAQKPKNGVDIPISLAIGSVKTPEFVAKHDLYFMEIEAQWLLPAGELKCKMGFGVVPPNDKCRAEEVVEVEWRVLDGESVVAHGSAGGISDQFEAGKDYLGRYIGQFQGQSKHKYVVELTFTKDGSSLNVTNPRLVVSPPGFAF
jgi:hypothetical protein